MLYRKASVLAFACALAGAGCRDNGPLTPADLSMTGGGGSGGGDMAMSGGGKNYTVAPSIAAMRQGAPGDYELDDVIAIALTPSSTSPHLVVQDAAGGDFSAVKTNCSSTSTSHPCTVASTVKTTAIGHKVTLKGTFIKASNANGGTEDFYIDSITDNGAGTLPAVAMVAMADVTRNAQSKKYWFQHVQVTSPGTLGVYDLSPSELVFSGATKCSYQLGFGLAPSATAGAAAMTSCQNTTSQPAGSTAPDAAEVLIGTDFYNNFKVSSDCRCAAMFQDTQVAGTMTTTKLGGILNYESVFGSMPVKTYQYLAPLDNTSDLDLK